MEQKVRYRVKSDCKPGEFKKGYLNEDPNIQPIKAT